MEPWRAAYHESGARMRARRKQIGMSQAELSRRTGVSAKIIYRCEHADGVTHVNQVNNHLGLITVNIALRIAPHLNCTPAYLLFGI